MDLTLIKLQQVYVITGYATPTTSKHLFQKQVNILADLVPFTSKLIIIGDFNFDNCLANNRQFFQFLIPQRQLRSGFSADSVTTIYGSQLDVIYTDLETSNSQIYTTVLSDHDPIYIQILQIDQK